MGNFIDITNKKFGRLLALEAIHNKGRGKDVNWRCLCDCGNETFVTGDNLRKERTQSCGCIRSEQLARRNKNTRRYAVNEKFFNKIDTEEKAYWLGFLSADGNISSDRLSLTVGLQQKDIEHLQKLKIVLQSEHPIKYVTRTKSVRMIIGSEYMMADLINLGCVPAKSLILNPCKTIPENLQRHYWRGFVDGDGSVSRNGISLCGTNSVCSSFSIYIKLYVESHAKPRRHKNIYTVRFSGRNQEIMISNLLYKNAMSTARLTRKYESAKKLMCMLPSRESPIYKIQETV